MATQDSSSGHASSDAAPAPPVVPPIMPPPLRQPPGRSGFRTGPVVITLVCVAGFVMVLLMGLGLWGVMSALHGSRTSFLPNSVGPGTTSRTYVTSATHETQIVPGVTHVNDRISRGPWSIHVTKIDRSRKDLGFFASLATGKVLGVARISEQAEAVPPEIGVPVAGVNGDFYERGNRTYAGDPRGLQIVNGELVSGTSTACVWFDSEDNPHVDDVKGDFRITWPDGHQTAFGLDEQRQPNMIVLYTPTYGDSTRAHGGRDIILEKDGDGPWLPLQAGQTYHARVRAVQPAADTELTSNTMVLSIGPAALSSLAEVAVGAGLQISTATDPDLKGVRTAIGGGPALIKDGKPFSRTIAPPGAFGDYSERSKYERHPRSAIGWSPSHLYLVTVDGRQPGLSVGMTLAELADYMVKLGCTDGMNFDGGASASMWVSGEIVNSPCQGERPVASALFVVRKPNGR